MTPRTSHLICWLCTPKPLLQGVHHILKRGLKDGRTYVQEKKKYLSVSYKAIHPALPSYFSYPINHPHNDYRLSICWYLALVATENMSKVGRVPALWEFTPPPLSAKNHTVGQQVKMMSFSQTKKSGRFFCLFVSVCLELLVWCWLLVIMAWTYTALFRLPVLPLE